MTDVPSLITCPIDLFCYIYNIYIYIHHSLPLYITLEQHQIRAETHLTILNEVQR